MHVKRDAFRGLGFALAVRLLPPLLRDPFDRILIAQARVEGMEFVTVDGQLAAYGENVRRV